MIHDVFEDNVTYSSDLNGNAQNACETLDFDREPTNLRLPPHFVWKHKPPTSVLHPTLS